MNAANEKQVKCTNNSRAHLLPVEIEQWVEISCALLECCNHKLPASCPLLLLSHDIQLLRPRPKLYRLCHWHSSVGCLLHLQQTQGRRRTTQSTQ
jgi:hypothetical protein